MRILQINNLSCYSAICVKQSRVSGQRFQAIDKHNLAYNAGMLDKLNVNNHLNTQNNCLPVARDLQAIL